MNSKNKNMNFFSTGIEEKNDINSSNNQIDFGADKEVTKKLTNYFNNMGSKLKNQKFKIAKEDNIFFL